MAIPSIKQIIQDVQGGVERGVAEFHAVIDQHMPALQSAAELVEKFATEPLFQAAEAALGLPESTRLALANVVTSAAQEFVALAQKLDAATADAQAAHAALNPPVEGEAPEEAPAA